MIERVGDLAAFAALRRDWDRLYDASGVSNPFLTHDWIAAWLAHMAHGEGVVLVHRPRSGAPLDSGILLTTEHSGRWCVPTEHIYRQDVLCRRGMDTPLRPFLFYIASHEWQIWRVMLHRCHDTPGLRAEIDRTLGPLRFLCLPHDKTIPSHVIDVGQPFAVYLASRPGKVRQELNRKARQFDKSVPGARVHEVDLLAGHPSGQHPAQVAGEAVRIIEEVEADSWKADAGTAIISSDRELAFYKAVLTIRNPRTRGRLFVLEGDAGPMAFVLGIQHDDVFYALKTSFRADQAKRSPGQVLFFRIIEELCDREPATRSLELLGMDSRWKRELASSARIERTFEIIRPDPAGLAFALTKKKALPALRAAAARDPRVARLLQLARNIRHRLQPSVEEKPQP